MKKHTIEHPEDEATNPRNISEDSSGRFDSALDGHFLAGRTLRGRKVTSLLLSASFGSNAILYAAFLGYVMGLWALIIQLAWALSFYLFAMHSKKIYASTSLHEFLGTHFGSTTRRIAATCSIIGITYFVGWEIAVASSSVQSVVGLSNHTGDVFWQNMPIVLLVAAIVSAIIYSSVWGRRASATVNVFLNTIKIACLVLIAIILCVSVAVHNGISINLLFPPLQDAILGLGIIGFITNIIFNLSWQFVDNSSWQSVSSAVAENVKNARRTIKYAGLATILTVNGIGTLIGAVLRPSSSVDSTNILGVAVNTSEQFQLIALISMIVMIVLSAASLFDQAILSISQSLIVDLGLKRRSKKVTLRYARIVTLIVGILAAWVVNWLIQRLGGSIFDFVYIVIIAQLSLIGPIVVGLTRSRHVKGMWFAIVLSLLAGAGATIIGILNGNQDLLQVAGTITTIVSIATAAVLYWNAKRTKQLYITDEH